MDKKDVLRLSAVMTPPHNIILAGGEGFAEAVPTLVDYLRGEEITVPGVIGPVEIADMFDGAWAQSTGQTSEVGMHQRVYELRQGYASALVARLSQHLLDLGYQFINLFTDLQNPTSNAIYQKIGYRPVCDFRMYKFQIDTEG